MGLILTCFAYWLVSRCLMMWSRLAGPKRNCSRLYYISIPIFQINGFYAARTNAELVRRIIYCTNINALILGYGWVPFCNWIHAITLWLLVFRTVVLAVSASIWKGGHQTKSAFTVGMSVYEFYGIWSRLLCNFWLVQNRRWRLCVLYSNVCGLKLIVILCCVLHTVHTTSLAKEHANNT